MPQQQIWNSKMALTALGRSNGLTAHLEPMKVLKTLGDNLDKQARRWTAYTYPVDGSENFSISGEQRDDLVRWLVHLNSSFKFHPETVSLAVVILDRFLHAVKVRAKYLRLIAVAAIYLAAKTVEEDEIVPCTLEFVRTTECGYTVSEVTRMERVVLDKLQWDLNASTPLPFLHIFHTLLVSQCPHLLKTLPSKMTPSRQVTMLTDKLHRLAANHKTLVFPPATLALATLSLELEQFTSDWLQPTFWLQTLAKVDSNSLINCREAVSNILNRVFRTRLVHMAPGLVSMPFAGSSHCTDSLGSSQVKKRKMEEVGDDDDDIYEGIKRLYNEDGPEFGASSICAREMRTETAALVPPTIKAAN